MSRLSVSWNQVSFEVQPYFRVSDMSIIDLEKYAYAFLPRHQKSNNRPSVVFVFSLLPTTT